MCFKFSRRHRHVHLFFESKRILSRLFKRLLLASGVFAHKKNLCTFLTSHEWHSISLFIFREVIDLLGSCQVAFLNQSIQLSFLKKINLLF